MIELKHYQIRMTFLIIKFIISTYFLKTSKENKSNPAAEK